jgi:DNA-binding GntR family transcriptional regulator
LEHQGFVERVSARKTRITALSRQDTDEIYAIRVPLELLVVEQLARASNVNWQEMDRACERMSIASKAQILQDFENADLDFHRAMWSLVGNRHLTDILERLVGKLFAYEAMVIRRRHIPPSNFKIQFKQHASLLRALKAGEVEAAKQALVGSMDRTWEDDLGLPEKSDFREL